MAGAIDLGAINWAGGLSTIGYWMGYLLAVGLILGVFIAIYLFLGYKYKVTIMERRGSGHKYDPLTADHSIGRVVKDRAKEVKDKGIIKWKLLKSRKTIQPPELSAIYPNNNVFLYKLGTQNYVPVNFTCSNPSASFSPLPQHIRYWEQLEIRQAAEDYQKQSTWEKYGPAILTMAAIFFCLLLAGFTIYYSVNSANGVSGALNSLTSTIKNSNVLQGVA